MNVNWLAVIVGAVLAYGLGALWYSPMMFVKKWAEGCRIDMTANTGGSMLPAMLTQAVGTFMLAWVIGITATTDSLMLAILIASTTSVLIITNGLFAQKSTYAVMVEAGYVVAMVVIMILVHAVL